MDAMTLPILCFDGCLVPQLNRWKVTNIDLARDLSPLLCHRINSKRGLNVWPAWLDGWIDKQVAKSDGPYVAAGFSAGAPAAARLAERDQRCVGLIYISGLEWRPTDAEQWWTDCPALCLATNGELAKLTEGTEFTADALTFCGCAVDYHEAPTPINPDTNEPWDHPHLAGAAHHRATVMDWYQRHFGGNA